VPSRVSDLYLLGKQRRSCPCLDVVTTKARHAGEPKRILVRESDSGLGGGFEGALLAVKGRRGDQPHVTVMLMVEVVKIKVKGMVEMVDIDMQW
jgi:hypothetical protein